MSDPVKFDPEDGALFGLDPTPTEPGAVEAAARRSLAALAGVLDDRHAVMAAGLVTAARQLDRAAASSKAKDYGVANLLAQLRETWAALMPTEEGTSRDPWDELARELGRAAAVRDTAEPVAED